MNCFITVIQLKCSTNQLNRICSVTKKIGWWFHNGTSVHTKLLSARGNTVNLIGIARKIVHVLKKTNVEKCVKMQISLTKYTKYSITIYSTNQVGYTFAKVSREVILELKLWHATHSSQLLCKPHNYLGELSSLHNITLYNITSMTVFHDMGRRPRYTRPSIEIYIDRVSTRKAKQTSLRFP
jgi:hypothetical protein